MPRCNRCGDSGVIETGNNDLPCDCPAGDVALFNQAGVVGPVTGAEIRRHFMNDSPEVIIIGAFAISASDLPGRRDRAIDLGELENEVRKLLLLLENPAPDFSLWSHLMLRRLANLHELTARALGK